MDDRTGLGSDHTDSFGKFGSSRFVLSCKQPLCGQFLLPLLDQQVLLPETGLLHLLYLQLVRPVRCIQP